MAIRAGLQHEEHFDSRDAEIGRDGLGEFGVGFCLGHWVSQVIVFGYQAHACNHSIMNILTKSIHDLGANWDRRIHKVTPEGLVVHIGHNRDVFLEQLEDNMVVVSKTSKSDIESHEFGIFYGVNSARGARAVPMDEV